MSPKDVLRPGWLREEVNKASERVGQLSNRQEAHQTGSADVPASAPEASATPAAAAKLQGN